MSEKMSFGDVEKAGHNDSLHDEVVMKHGDRALAYIGDERVTVTEEDVS
jgi:hypothetical protein